MRHRSKPIMTLGEVEVEYLVAEEWVSATVGVTLTHGTERSWYEPGWPTDIAVTDVHIEFEGGSLQLSERARNEWGGEHHDAVQEACERRWPELVW